MTRKAQKAIDKIQEKINAVVLDDLRIRYLEYSSSAWQLKHTVVSNCVVCILEGTYGERIEFYSNSYDNLVSDVMIYLEDLGYWLIENNS